MIDFHFLFSWCLLSAGCLNEQIFFAQLTWKSNKKKKKKSQFVLPWFGLRNQMGREPNEFTLSQYALNLAAVTGGGVCV